MMLMAFLEFENVCDIRCNQRLNLYSGFLPTMRAVVEYAIYAQTPSWFAHTRALAKWSV